MVCVGFFFFLKRGASLRDFSSTGEECFVILTCLVRGIASPGCALSPSPLRASFMEEPLHGLLFSPEQPPLEEPPGPVTTTT